MRPEETRNLRLNYAVNILDGAFFGLGLGFASFSTVIPLFVSTLTDSAILIGLISAVHVTGWQLPQLFTAKSVSRMSRYKPMVIMMTIQERIPFLGLALIALFYHQIGSTPAIILTFAMLLWQGFGAGFTANPWQNLIAKIIPSDALATFFGFQSSAANLLASAGALFAGFLLEHQPLPLNFFYCFIIAFGILAVSLAAISLTRESSHEVVPAREDQKNTWHNMLDILRRDRNFAWFLLGRMIVQLGTMAFSFYTVYASTRLHAGSYTIGLLTSVLLFSQVITNPLLGWIADHWSRKGVLAIGAVAIVASTIIARFAPTAVWLFPAMILVAVASTAFWTITMAMTLEFGGDDERPMYVGMANTLIAPATILAPIIGGWLADSRGYSSTFLMSAVAGIAAAVIFQFFVKDPKQRI